MSSGEGPNKWKLNLSKPFSSTRQCYILWSAPLAFCTSEGNLSVERERERPCSGSSHSLAKPCPPAGAFLLLTGTNCSSNLPRLGFSCTFWTPLFHFCCCTFSECPWVCSLPRSEESQNQGHTLTPRPHMS